MKYLLPLLALSSSCLAGTETLSSSAPAADPKPSSAAGDGIPIGIEVVTGYHSEYIHRGFKLTDDLIDVQLEAEIALSNEWVLNLGGYYGTGTGDEDFTEASGFLDLRYEAKKWTAGVAATYRDYQQSFFKDGVDINPNFTWHLTDDWDLGAGVAYDTAEDGWYGNLEATWSHPLGNSSFITAKAGTSFTSDYYGSDGWHDLYARLSYTYAFNKSVSVTPFLGTSIPMESSPETDRLFGGVWFEVNF